ncbi:hypothetical protein Tco_0614369, partial [Tanacetum coccineum]
TIRYSRLTGVGSVSGGNDQPAFVSVGVSAETAHTAAEGPAAPTTTKAPFPSAFFHNDKCR